MSSITSEPAPPISARRISRFRQRGSDQLGPGPIDRAQLSPRVREKLDRIRREDTLNWMAHSAWIAAWATVTATLVVVVGLGACMGSLLGAIHPLVAQANPHLVVMVMVTVVAVSVPAGALAYALARTTHPARITRGRTLRGPTIGLGVGATVALAGVALAMPWSFPHPNVLHDSAAQIQTLAADHEIVQGSVFEEPYGSDLYFEVTIGAWIETPVRSFGPGSVYAHVMAAASPNPLAQLAHVAGPVGAPQTAGLRDRLWYEWALVGALTLGAVAAGFLQRRKWSTPLLAPPVDDEIIRQVWQADREAE
jgi:hypothetical protein